MGWSSGDHVFDPVARELIAINADPEVQRRVLTVLIKTLRDHDWDTAEESLGEFAEHPAVVQAFRDNDIVLQCGNEDGPQGSSWCERELGHKGDHDDRLGRTWPQVPPTEGP